MLSHLGSFLGYVVVYNDVYESRNAFEGFDGFEAALQVYCL